LNFLVLEKILFLKPKVSFGSKKESRLIIKNNKKMNKNRIEAFSDGVIAIIIDIMVLEDTIPLTV
jgi:hypothetical protein